MNNKKKILVLSTIGFIGVITFLIIINKQSFFTVLSNFNEIKNINYENQQLEYALKEYKNLPIKLDFLEKENKNLKGLLKQKEFLENDKGYKTIVGTVIYRDMEKDFYNYLIINKGKNNEIEKNMIVVSKNGLIGKIVEVYNDSSKVSLISTNESKSNNVSVYLKSDKNITGIIKEYDKEKDLFLIETIKDTNEIENGSDILSSGLGGLYPGDLNIGKVTDNKKDIYGLSHILYVKPDVDFYDISDVLVIK